MQDPSQQYRFDTKREKWEEAKNANSGKRAPASSTARQTVKARSSDMTESKQFLGYFWPLAYYIEAQRHIARFMREREEK